MNDQLSPTPQPLPTKTAEPNQALRFEMSPSIGKLIGALAKARKQFTPIIKANENPFFKSKYADLADVIEATKEGLSANGLAVIQFLGWESISGLTIVTTLLAHDSGEWIRGILELPTSKRDAQGIGSSSTYGRRYSYSAILNVASESDDDGSAAVSKGFTKEQVEEAADKAEYLKLFELKAIDDACKASGKTEDEIKAYLSLIGVERIEKIQRSGFKSTLAWANAKGIHKPSKGPSPADQNRITANKKLWASAAEHSVSEADVKQYAYETYKVQSMTELTAGQLAEVTSWVEGV